jgi:hypothetical protein
MADMKFARPDETVGQGFATQHHSAEQSRSIKGEGKKE